MIKYLQKLRAKKGFTLVELIVVIAIIGVLAAILIPTMLGYVTSSRVTSADTTASEIQKSVNNWLTDMDSKGVGMKKKTDAVGVVYMSFAAGNAGGGSSVSARCTTADIATLYNTASWNVKTSVCSTGTELENNFEQYLGDLLPDGSGSACAVIVGGDCKFVIWTPDSEAGTAAAFGSTEAGQLIVDYSTGVNTFAGWTGGGNNAAGLGTNGIGSDGQTYGTAPVAQNAVQ